MLETSGQSYHDVLKYPEKFLKMKADSVCVSVSYKKSWDDGYGVRGWKLDASIGDPQIIASTRETGKRINTSVFVHDILDHYLSGFGISGHRSEAMALIQLEKRTGSSPESDYKQIISEDILNGRFSGETLRSFLPQQLLGLLSVDENISDIENIKLLKKRLGESTLKNTLLEYFYKIGRAGDEYAKNSWIKLGLDKHQQTRLGLALQELLINIDIKAEDLRLEALGGWIVINENDIEFRSVNNRDFNASDNYRVFIN